MSIPQAPNQPLGAPMPTPNGYKPVDNMNAYNSYYNYQQLDQNYQNGGYYNVNQPLSYNPAPAHSSNYSSQGSYAAQYNPPNVNSSNDGSNWYYNQAQYSQNQNKTVFNQPFVQNPAGQNNGAMASAIPNGDNSLNLVSPKITDSSGTSIEGVTNPTTINSESSLSSSPEHSTSDTSPTCSGAEGGESESTDSDAISATTNTSEHANQQLISNGSNFNSQQNSQYNQYSAKANNNLIGRRPTNNPETHSYPTPNWQQSRNQYASQFPQQQQPPVTNTSIYNRPTVPQMQPGPPAPPSRFPPPHNLSYNNQQTALPSCPPNFAPQAPPPSQLINSMPGQFSNMSLNQSVSSSSPQPVNLLANRHILPPKPVEPVIPTLPKHLNGINCDPNIFRCTINAIPQKEEDIKKAKLPFGLLIHPFRDLQNLPVIQSPVIVRCKSCRTYINPFVTFVDQRRWKCNMCYRANEIPPDFAMSSNGGRCEDVTKRPEICNATVEFIAPGDYMLRPPQAALYLFLLDVTAQAMATGYLDIVCSVLKQNLSSLPGDARTKISIICFDSSIHYLAVVENQHKAQLLTFADIEDLELPRHDDLLVNLHENLDKITALLTTLPDIFRKNVRTQSALGSALNAGQKLLASTGGRITVFQSVLPSLGPGKLSSREDPNERASTEVKNLKPITDFYKTLALTSSGNQIAIDLFAINAQYIDMATLSGMSRFSAGNIQAFPNLTPGSIQAERLEKDFTRYLIRKLGFEAVLRVRCTKGLTVSDFFGNFFVRSTDLLAFSNVNPDAGVSMRVRIEETLTSASHACFQAALLYTSSKGERRIRVHTLYIPIANSVPEVVASADVQAVTCFLAQMAVDRSLDASISDARDALLNAVSDCLAAYRSSLPGYGSSGGTLLAPPSLSLFALYVSGLLKSKALRIGNSTKLDERVFAMLDILAMPIFHIMHMIYPPLYPVHNIHQQPLMGDTEELSEQTPTNVDLNKSFSFSQGKIPQPNILQLSAESLSRDGAYLLDRGNLLVLLVRSQVPIYWCMKVLDIASAAAIPSGGMRTLPTLDNPVSQALRAFIDHLLDSRPNHAPLLIIRDEDPQKSLLLECLVDDRTENSSSYVEFLQHINNCIAKTKK